jgi:hypothetical protein
VNEYPSIARWKVAPKPKPRKKRPRWLLFLEPRVHVPRGCDLLPAAVTVAEVVGGTPPGSGEERCRCWSPTLKAGLKTEVTL